VTDADIDGATQDMEAQCGLCFDKLGRDLKGSAELSLLHLLRIISYVELLSVEKIYIFAYLFCLLPGNLISIILLTPLRFTIWTDDLQLAGTTGVSTSGNISCLSIIDFLQFSHRLLGQGYWIPSMKPGMQYASRLPSLFKWNDRRFPSPQ